GEAGDADQGVPRQPDGDVFEGVLAGPMDDKLLGGHAVGSLSSDRTFVQASMRSRRRWRGDSHGENARQGGHVATPAIHTVPAEDGWANKRGGSHDGLSSHATERDT